MFFAKKDYTFADLLDIMKILCGGNGCPWDRAQTHQSIKYSLLEEACEAMESLDKKEPAAFADELGDVLLQVVFHAEIAEKIGAEVVQVIGYRFVLYKRAENPENRKIELPRK